MRRYTTVVYLVLSVILMGGSIFSLFEGRTYAQQRPTATFYFGNVFPDSLACNFAEIGWGPSWGEIQIGSTVEELISTYNQYDVLISPNQEDASSRVTFDGRQDYPLNYRMCIIDNRVVAVEGYPPSLHPNISTAEATVDPSARALLIDDLVIEFGIPDAVTYTFNHTHRVAFWFEEGFAAVVRVVREEGPTFFEFGSVVEVVFFPYQSSIGYQTQWPYNRTYPEPLPVNDENVPNEQYPFTFDVMLVTITAQLSRTPTSTIAPRASTPTVTPTP